VWFRGPEISPQISRIDPQISRIDPQISRIDPQISRIDPQISRIDPQISQIDPQISRIEEDFDVRIRGNPCSSVNQKRVHRFHGLKGISMCASVEIRVHPWTRNESTDSTD